MLENCFYSIQYIISAKQSVCKTRFYIFYTENNKYCMDAAVTSEN